MDLELTPADRAFQIEVQTFLDTHLTADLRAGAKLTTSVFADYDLNIRWHRILHQKGWVAPHWPAQYGGTGWSEMQRYIFAAECARACPTGAIVLKHP